MSALMVVAFACTSTEETSTKSPKATTPPSPVVFWTSGEAPTPPPVEPARADIGGEAQPRSVKKARVTATPGWVSQAFPTGDIETSTLLVERNSPAEVTVNQPYEYVIKVTNLTMLPLENVVLRDVSAGNFDVKDSSPKCTIDGDVMTFPVGAMAPEETKSIRVSGVAKEPGSTTQCCDVAWDSHLCATTRVVNPKLVLVKTGPASTIMCDPIDYEFKVTNAGTGEARNVVIEDKLPESFVTADKQTTVRIPVGVLQSGETKTQAVRVMATKTGTFKNVAKAMGDDGLTAESAEVTTLVTKPLLTITKKGPATAYPGRTATYDIAVKNTGDGEARDTVLEDAIPAGASFVSATENGVAAGNKVTWNFGTLRPGDSRTARITLNPGPGPLVKNSATVKAFCADAVTATVETQVVGVPAVLLEVIDLDDPIALGGNQTYEIVVTNQGTAPDTNVKIFAILENANQEFVSASGPAKFKADRGTITFEPYPTLAPKAKITYRVVVKCIGEGDTRFRVNLTSDHAKRPIEESESTNIYP